jgi:2-polyprenyl-6-methoxyphenol hydroxylase-like FAD-dependent oxidoreductase
VLIAGAGPTGLSLALLLARQGIAVQVLENRPTAAGLPRGEAIMPSGMAALAAMGLLPLPASVRQRPLDGWCFWLQGRPLFRVAEPADRGEPCRLVDPDSLLSFLVEHVRQQPCAELRLSCGASGLTETQGRISGLHLENGEQLEADLVVACDGRSSLLRRCGGLASGTRQRPIDVLWFQLQAAGSEALSEALAGDFHTLVGDAGSLALYASPSGAIQLGWPQQPGLRQPRTATEWRDLWCSLAPPSLARALAALPAQAIRGPQRLPVEVGLAQRWWRPGLLLLGDAAHPMSPLRAQGTAMGLRDALTAAALLSPALHAQSANRAAALASALAELEHRRRPEISLIQRLQQREWQRGERLLHNPGLRRLLAALAPGLSPLLAASWWHSQTDLRRGLAGSEPSTWPPPAMMDSITVLP